MGRGILLADQADAEGIEQGVRQFGQVLRDGGGRVTQALPEIEWRLLLQTGLLLGDKISPPIPPWVFAILFAIPFLAWPSIAVPRRGYVVRDKDIVFRCGVIFRSVTAVPFNRIQHVETSSTPLDRKFDIAALQIFTAGGSGGDLKIDGLSADVAERLRVYILDKVGASVEDA